jgi:hypothetical protein
MPLLPDFTTQEKKLVTDALLSRFRTRVALHEADSEIGLDPDNQALTVCPTLVWEQMNATFILVKTERSVFRCQFLTADNEQFSPSNTNEFSNLKSCVVALLQIHADYERNKSMKDTNL